MKARALTGLFLVAVLSTVASGGANPARDPDESTTEHGNPTAAREQWFLRGRRSATGESPARMRARALQQKSATLRANSPAAADQAQELRMQPYSFGSGPAWQPLGPAPLVSDPTGNQSYGLVAGRVTAVTVDQSDTSGNTVYIGSAYGGVWKSTNAAAANPASVRWTALTDDQATLSIGAVAVSPNGQTVLVGTGEPNNSGDSYYGLGILRSTSAGAPDSWTLISSANGGAHPFTGLGVSKIAFNTNLPADVVAAVAHASITEGLADQTVGLYYSLDGGATWSLASVTDSGAPVSSGSVTDVVFDANHNVFYAAYRAHGIYQSLDSGKTWTRASNQPDPNSLNLTNCPSTIGTNSLTTCPLYRAALTFNPSTNELFTMVIGINSSNGDVDNGVWKSFTSSNGTSAWAQISDSGITSCGDSAGCGVKQGTYDLELLAVPNGSGSDLYIGLVNLYKSVNGAGFSNISHVYGCNPIAFHPDNHGIDFVQSNAGIIYFGNDGGVYRTTNASALSGSCSASSALMASLDQNIGSLTQFIWFSQNVTNPAVILGGTQDNGSPATAGAGSSATWAEANLGDGGWNAIDPSGSIWFTANTDVSIQRCAQGSNCNLFGFTPLVNVASNLGTVNFPDHGDFYTPYMLDPANPGRIIIGTCRVWRGSSSSSTNWSSSSFANALSNKLNSSNTGANTACGGSEAFFVRSLAAGGAATGSGSQVIYAGMSSGVDATGAPVGGNIWVTTNAAGGTSTWHDRTGAINPHKFDVSSVELDPFDPSGNTAYLTLMGFTGRSSGHVFKTTNAGVTWSDVSGNLPDAPADAIVVDPTNRNDLFVATDVGVFRSTNGGAAWSAFGKFFPNVVVTNLGILNSGGALLLRAGTHGRGVWQIGLTDFDLSIATPVVTAFPNQAATFSGSVTPLGSYNSPVNLSCQAGIAGTLPDLGCNPNPASVSPPGAFNVSAIGSTPQDYNFSIQGAGAGIMHSQPVTLRVIDYGLSQPAAIPVAYPNAPATTSFTVSALGAFNQAVNLSCSGLPQLATCNFSPSSTVNPSPSGSVNVTVSITASNFSTAGNYNITINASTANAPAGKSVSFNFTLEDFSLSTPTPQQVLFPSQSAAFNANLNSLNGYALPVSLVCIIPQGTQGATCAPSVANQTSPYAPFTVNIDTTASTPTQDFTFTLQGTGSDPATNVRQLPLLLRVVDFALSAISPGSVTMPQGAISQPINFNIVPLGSFAASVTLDCTGLPAGTNCNFNGMAAPATLAISNSALPVALTIVTTASATPGATTVTITATTPKRPAGLPARSGSFGLTINTAAGTTDMSVADAAPESATAGHAVGQPLTLQFTVSNTAGSAVGDATLYVNFAQPVTIQSLDPQCGTGSSTPGFAAAMTCVLTNGLAAPGNTTVTMTVFPGFTRTVSATALITSSTISDSQVGNNTVGVTRNVRPRPFARQGLPAILP